MIMVKRCKQDFCNIVIYPYNKITNHFCDKVHEKIKVWGLLNSKINQMKNLSQEQLWEVCKKCYSVRKELHFDQLT